MYSETPNDTISLDYFFNMMSPQAEEYSKEYDDEEAKILTDVCSKIVSKDYNLIVIAGGRQRYLGVSIDRFKSYTNIEPLADTYIGAELMNLCRLSQYPINVVCKRFGDAIPGDLPSGPNVYFFIFNIVCYLEEPFNKLSAVLKPGDIIIFSTWATNDHAKMVRRKYFNFLNKQELGTQVNPDLDDKILSPGMLDEDKIPTSFSKQIIQKRVVSAYVYSC